jgi:nitroreductase
MFIDLARKRRSIRRFAETPVEKEKVDYLVEALLRSLSSRGSTPWEFVVVTQKETIALLSSSKPQGAAFLKNAPLAVAVCADPQTSDVWVEDAAIAMTFGHLAAADLGLGSCWIQLRKRQFSESQTAGARAAELIGLPAGLEVLAILAVGYPAEEKPGHPASELKNEKVHYERYGNTAG